MMISPNLGSKALYFNIMTSLSLKKLKLLLSKVQKDFDNNLIPVILVFIR